MAHDLLLRRLRDHVEHGVELSDHDMEDSADPSCLVLVAMLAGNLSRFRSGRTGGAHGPLTQRAHAYARADALACHITIALEHRLAGFQ